MTSLAFKSQLAHLEAEDRWEAESMLMALGLKYYGLISHTRVVDMYTLKKIYVKSMGSKEEQENKAAMLAMAWSLPGALPVKLDKDSAPVSAADSSSSTKARHPHISSTSVFPFVDKANTRVKDVISSAVQNANGASTETKASTPFLGLALPVQKRLSADVFTDLSTGRRGMRIVDIPDGLQMLGLELEPELAAAFRGRSQDVIITGNHWLTVVKRFVAREEAKQDAYLESDGKLAGVGSGGQAESSEESKAAAAAGVGPFRELEQEAKSQFDSRGRTERRQNFATVFARYQRKDRLATKQEESTKAIADMFLKGPVGKDLYEIPSPWWEASNADDVQGYNPSLRRMWGPNDTDESETESLDAREERRFLRALNLPVSDTQAQARQYKNSIALRDSVDFASHPALVSTNNTLSGVKSKYSKDDMLFRRMQESRQSERDATQAEGWARRKGGWVADFGQPRRSKDALAALAPSLASNRAQSTDEMVVVTEALIESESSVDDDAPGYGGADDGSTAEDTKAVAADPVQDDQDAARASGDNREAVGGLSAETLDMLSNRIRLANANFANIPQGQGLEQTKAGKQDPTSKIIANELRKALAASSAGGGQAETSKRDVPGDSVTSASTASYSSSSSSSSSTTASVSVSSASTQEVSASSNGGAADLGLSPMSQKVGRVLQGADTVTVNVQHPWNKK